MRLSLLQTSGYAEVSYPFGKVKYITSVSNTPVAYLGLQPLDRYAIAN